MQKSVCLKCDVSEVDRPVQDSKFTNMLTKQTATIYNSYGDI